MSGGRELSAARQCKRGKSKAGGGSRWAKRARVVGPAARGLEMRAIDRRRVRAARCLAAPLIVLRCAPISSSPPDSCRSARSSTATKEVMGSVSARCTAASLYARSQSMISTGRTGCHGARMGVAPITSQPYSCSVCTSCCLSFGMRRQSVDRTILAPVARTTDRSRSAQAPRTCVGSFFSREGSAAHATKSLAVARTKFLILQPAQLVAADDSVNVKEDDAHKNGPGAPSVLLGPMSVAPEQAAHGALLFS